MLYSTLVRFVLEQIDAYMKCGDNGPREEMNEGHFRQREARVQRT